uniref:Uncharacterized protein n=1 Tax=Pararge aegeria TaxID=116150 RepID=S4NSW4_9NEOP
MTLKRILIAQPSEKNAEIVCVILKSLRVTGIYLFIWMGILIMPTDACVVSQSLLIGYRIGNNKNKTHGRRSCSKSNLVAALILQ